MEIDDIKAIQREIGVKDDGRFGPISRAACKRYLATLCPNNPWPTQADRFKFFGAPGTNLYALPVGDLGIRYEGKHVETISCNRKIAESLRRILFVIANSPWSHVLDDYAGCFANKPLMHGVGGAIDLDPDENGMQDNWPTNSTMPWGVIKIFAREGWTSGGAYWGYDGMHFQATRWPN